MTDQMIEILIREGGGGFKPEEFLDNRDQLEPNIVMEIVAFRNWKEIIDRGIMLQITSAMRYYGSHKLGLALDFLMWTKWREEQPNIYTMWCLMTTWPWMGVGIYFDWKDGIGFHADIINPPHRQRPLRWLRVNGVYYYQSMTDGRFHNKKKGATTLEEQIRKYKGNHG